MNRDELRSFLLTNNTVEAPDWESIKNTYHAEPIEFVNEQPVYEFNYIRMTSSLMTIVRADSSFLGLPNEY